MYCLWRKLGRPYSQFRMCKVQFAETFQRTSSSFDILANWYYREKNIMALFKKIYMRTHAHTHTHIDKSISYI
jgi:hypothetical protein